MEVSCKITEYSTESGKFDLGKVEVRSVFAEGNKIDIIIDGKPHRFCGTELASAIGKCELNCYGR